MWSGSFVERYSRYAAPNSPTARATSASLFDFDQAGARQTSWPWPPYGASLVLASLRRNGWPPLPFDGIRDGDSYADAANRFLREAVERDPTIAAGWDLLLTSGDRTRNPMRWRRCVRCWSRTIQGLWWCGQGTIGPKGAMTARWCTSTAPPPTAVILPCWGWRSHARAGVSPIPLAPGLPTGKASGTFQRPAVLSTDRTLAGYSMPIRSAPSIGSLTTRSSLGYNESGLSGTRSLGETAWRTSP